MIKFGAYDSSHVISGGLVGYAGNGCRAYDMHITHTDNTSVTIGTSEVNMSGVIVGLMQPKSQGSDECKAEFVNCELKEINVVGNKYAGGFYGGTWNTGNIGWVANKIKIDNCKVIGDSTNKNTISAEMCAGGFVADGLVWANDVPNIEIANSLVSNYNISNNVADTIIAPVTEYKPNNNCAKGNGEAVGVGGFIGYVDSQYNIAHVTCYIHDSSIEDCNITAKNSSAHAGGAVGQVVDNTANVTSGTAESGNLILGYNVKLKNITSDNPDNLGAWIGILNSDDTTTKIQFTGLGIYGNGFTQNVGNRASFENASFVYADYDGACANMTEDNENKATFNIDSDVDMPKYPYVNVNPQSNMGIRSDKGHVEENAVISGDGAVLLANNGNVANYNTYTSGRTMAAKLYDELANTANSRRYTTFAETMIDGTSTKYKDMVIADGHTLRYYLQRTTNDDGDRISTYKTEKGTLPNGVKDFACIMISTADDTETTNLINQYIRLVTNTTDDYTKTSDYYDVDVKTCQLVTDEDTDYSEFKLITDENDPYYPASVTLTKGTNGASGKFSMVKANADSTRTNTFTLIDVQFKDPLNTNKVAYHLYVPVYTTVQMEVNFYAAMKTGAYSNTYKDNGTIESEYEKLLNKTDYPDYIHVDNLNTWYTMYFRYSYAKSDLEGMLSAGNLNWNHDKYVILTKEQPLTIHIKLCNPLNPCISTFSC